MLLYNSYTGHRCAIPANAAPYAKRYLSRVGWEGPLDWLGEYLLKKGYLVRDDVNESARFDVRYGITQFRTDVLQLILLSSEDCNFRCIYCSQEFKRGSMLPGVRSGVRNLVLKRVRKLNCLAVNWFGGEPLLGYDVIEELAPFFQNIAKEHDVSFSSHITTNGYLLTPARSLQMVQWGITAYQITIDGTAEDHDSHRPLQGGGHTFHRILDNIVTMKDYKEEFQITLRVNFDNTNVDRMTPLFETLRASVGDDPRYELNFHPVGKWGGPNDDQLDVCGVSASRHTARLREEARSFGLQVEKLSHQLEPDGQEVCYAARPYNFVIGADGKVMKCTVVLDTEESNIVGTLSEQGDIDLNSDRFMSWVKPYYQDDAMCKKCFFVPVCQGASCPLPRIRRGERPCPPAKLEIRRTLIGVWSEEASIARSRQAPSVNTHPEERR